MANDSNIPVFEKSGNGLSYDLMTLEKQRILALGWWKGQFKRYLNEVTTKKWIDGVYCYDTNIRVGRNSCSSTEYNSAKIIGEYYVEADIVDSLKLISDGSFNFSANGVTYDIVGLDFTSIVNVSDIIDIINAELSATKILINVDEEQKPVYCETDIYTICDDGYGNDLYTTIEHKNLQIETTSRGDNSSITELTPSLVGTYVGDLLLLNKAIEDGYTTGVSEKVENTRSLLETIGFADSDIDQLCSDSKSKGIADIELTWAQDYSFDKEDFEYTVDLIIKALPFHDKVEVFNSCVSYRDSTHSAPYTPKSVSSSYNNLGSLNSEEGEPSRLQGFYDVIYKDSWLLDMENQTIIVYDNDVDITSTIDDTLLNILKSLLWISGNKAMNHVSNEVYNTQNYQLSDGTLEETYVKVTTKETYDGSLKSSFVDEYKYYSADCHGNVDEDDYCENGTYSSIYMNYLWLYREYDNTYQNGEEIAGLFYKSVNTSGWLGSESTTKLYMTVDGLDSISPLKLQDLISSHIKFGVIKKKCGSFFKCFFKAVLKFISEILRIISLSLYYIPMIKVQIQAMIWISTGGDKWVTDKDEFTRYTTIVVAAIISALVSFFTIGIGTPAAMAFFATMTAYTVYSAHKNIGELRDSIEFQNEIAKLEEKERKLIEEDIELDNGEIDESIFMPLSEDMKKMEHDHFGDDSMYTIKYK